jgi:hypothetical protein
VSAAQGDGMTDDYTGQCSETFTLNID